MVITEKCVDGLEQPRLVLTDEAPKPARKPRAASKKLPKDESSAS